MSKGPKVEKIHGGTIVGQAPLPGPRPGYRTGRVILVEGARITSVAFVVAKHYEDDKEWSHGAYFNSKPEAIANFVARINLAWDL